MDVRGHTDTLKGTHTILHTYLTDTYAQLYRHTSIHIHSDTRLHTHTHSQASTHTCLCGSGARQQTLSTMPQPHSHQMPLPSLLSPDITSMVGGWIPLSIPPNTVFLWLLLHYSSPVTTPRKQGCGRETEGRATVPALLGAQAPDQECWSSRRLHFPVCR